MHYQIQDFLIEHYQKGTKVPGKIVKIETDICCVDVGLEKSISVSLKFLSDYECDRLAVGQIREFWVFKDYSDRQCDRYYL